MKYIVRVGKNKDGTQRYQLNFHATDTGKQVYIKSTTDLGLLQKIRDKLVKNAPYTHEDLLRIRAMYKNPPREPRVSLDIIKTKQGTYRIMHKGHGYGTYPSLEEAEKWRDKLEEVDYDEEKVNLPIKRRNRKWEDRYIHHEPSGYFILRTENKDGRVIHHRYETCIPTLEEARRIRDEWENIDWDWENIDLL